MSEPVGSASRSAPSIPSNSHKSRQESEKNQQREEVEKVITGKVVMRKTPIFKRIGRSFVAEDAGSIGDYLIDDVVIPNLKYLIRSLLVGGVDRAMFGRTGGIGVGAGSFARPNISGQQSSMTVRYSQVPDGSRMGGPQQPQQLNSSQRARHAFNDIGLSSREEAVLVLQSLLGMIERYSATTVADLYQALGMTAEAPDRGWGWTDLSSATVKQWKDAWFLDLPAPQPFR